MEDLVKTIISGLKVVIWSVLTVFCFTFSVFILFGLNKLSGFTAVFIWSISIFFLLLGIFILYIIGLSYSDYNEMCDIRIKEIKEKLGKREAEDTNNV